MAFDSIFRSGLFADQVVVVTGGGSGIGRCVAHELVALGATVALVGRKLDKLERVQAELLEVGGTSSVWPLDIRVEADVAGAVTSILERHGAIHGLVNNAGGQFAAPLAAISQNGFEAVVRTNLTGGFLMARECFTQHMNDAGGSIVNIVADMWMGMPGMGHSGAARAGMVNFTETAACEWGFAHVRVNAVAPGWVAGSGFANYPESMRDQLRSLRREVPLGRLGTESEISAAIVFLLSPAASFISGATLRVDGAAPNYKRFWQLPERSASPEWNGFHLADKPDFLRDDDA